MKNRGKTFHDVGFYGIFEDTIVTVKETKVKIYTQDPSNYKAQKETIV